MKQFWLLITTLTLSLSNTSGKSWALDNFNYNNYNLLEHSLNGSNRQQQPTACVDGSATDATLSACNELIKNQPKNAAAYRNRGFALQANGSYDEAIANYTEALHLDPSDLVTKARLQIALGNKHMSEISNDIINDQASLFSYVKYGFTDEIRIRYAGDANLDGQNDTLTFGVEVNNHSADRVRLGEFVERDYRFINKSVFITEPNWPQSLKNMSLEVSFLNSEGDIVEPKQSVVINVVIKNVPKALQTIIAKEQELNGVLCFFSPQGVRYVVPLAEKIWLKNANNYQDEKLSTTKDADNTSLLIAVGFAVIGGIVIGSRFTTKKSNAQTTDASNQQQEREKERQEREKREREQQDRDRREKAEREQAQHERNKREQEQRAQEAREQAQREQAQRDRQEREQREKAQQERAQREQEQRDKSQREERAKETKRPWHEVLEVAPTASWEEIRAAYRKMIAMYHPDKVGSLGRELQELAERKSKEINEAYKVAERLRK